MSERPKKVLIVDDEQFIVYLLMNTLRSMNSSFVGALNGIEALALIKGGQTFDLIISDTNMPLMDGPAMVRELRQQGVQTPILMNSGASLQEEVEELLRNEAIQGFFPKPWDAHKLKELIARILDPS